jgi:hypothetical protein
MRLITLVLGLCLAFPYLTSISGTFGEEVTSLGFLPQPLTVMVDKVFKIAVVVESVNDLQGFDIEVNWNTSYLEYIDHIFTTPWNDHREPVSPSPYAGILYSGYEVSDSVDQINGTYKAAFATLINVPFNGSGTIVVITFKALNHVGTTHLEFTKEDLVDSGASSIPHTTSLSSVKIVQSSGVSIVSPENKVYPSDEVDLTFALSEPATWIGYSLDGIANETVTANTTLSTLLDGLHYIIVYANLSGAVNESTTVHFAVDTSPPSITGIVQAPSVNDVQPEDSVRVNASVGDDFAGVKRVTLNYTISDGTWIPLEMMNPFSRFYNTTIPKFANGTTVEFVIEAEDNVGNVITSEELGYTHQYTVVPEFPSMIVPMSLLIAGTLIALLYRARRTRTRDSSPSCERDNSRALSVEKTKSTIISMFEVTGKHQDWKSAHSMP